MSTITSAIKAFIADENGVTSIEYGLIAALVGVVIAAAAETLGTDISSVFTEVSTELKAAID